MPSHFDYIISGNIIFVPITSPVWSPKDAYSPDILRFASHSHSFLLELKSQATNTSTVQQICIQHTWSQGDVKLRVTSHVQPCLTSHLHPLCKLFAICETTRHFACATPCKLCAALFKLCMNPCVTSHVQPLYNLVESLTNHVWDRMWHPSERSVQPYATFVQSYATFGKPRVTSHVQPFNMP